MYFSEDIDSIAVMPPITPAKGTEKKYFTSGNPTMGQNATVWGHDIANIVVYELVNLVEKSGITLNKQSLTQVFEAVQRIAGSAGGIVPWDETETYDPLPHIVWGRDNMLYVAERPSGPGVTAGPQDPTTTMGYWLTLAQYINISEGGVNPKLPIGSVFYYARNTPPDHALVCNGAAISRIVYSDLYAVTGITFGSGDGSSTFNLPDLRAEFIRGVDMGRGVDASRAFGSRQKGSLIVGDTDETPVQIAPYHTLANGTMHDGLGMDVPNANDYRNILMTRLNSGGFFTIKDFEHMGIARPRNVALLPCIQFE